MDKKKLTSFAFVGILLGSFVSVVAMHELQDSHMSDDDISVTMVKAYEKAASLQVDAEVQAISDTNNVKYSMLGC